MGVRGARAPKPIRKPAQKVRPAGSSRVGSSSTSVSHPTPTPSAPVLPAGLEHTVRLLGSSAFPSNEDVTGLPVTVDVHQESMFLGLVSHDGGMQPCKVVKEFHPPVRFGYGGAEHIHADEYFLVPFDGARMEWVSTSHGRTPLGKRPVGGGREANGAPLLHAIAELPNYRVRTVGKAGEHLGGAHFPFAGAEIFVEYYEVLCWR